MICIVSREVHSCIFFFFNQKTAYEVRISDWSSDVCSSDLAADHLGLRSTRHGLRGGGDSKRQHPRDSDEGSDHAPALLVGESKRGPGPRSLSRSTCLEIHVDRREEIPSDDTIHPVVSVNSWKILWHNVENIIYAKADLILFPNVILQGQIIIHFRRDMLRRIGFVRIRVQFIGGRAYEARIERDVEIVDLVRRQQFAPEPGV